MSGGYASIAPPRMEPGSVGESTGGLAPWVSVTLCKTCLVSDVWSSRVQVESEPELSWLEAF